MTNIGSTTYNVIGLMSGTSLDGVDIAFCRFSFQDNKWAFSIEKAETIPYPKEWKEKLLGIEKTDAVTFYQAHTDYGFYLGSLVSDFIIRHHLKTDLVSSHGHTIFHQPEKKLLFQIGSGRHIAQK